MAQLNENYSNSNSVAVLGTSTHETSKVKVYEHPLFGKVRMYVENGKSWFCGMDIATSLQYSNPSKAIIDHCKPASITIREVGVQTGLKADGTPAIQMKSMKFISEGNIYRLITKSQMPKADDFESWIFDEIVPSVVNTGSYSVQPQVPQSFAEALQLAADQAKQIEAQQKVIEQKEVEKQAIIEETKPAVVFTECVKNSPTNILVRDLAKLITQNGFKIGEYRLYDWLVEKKYLIRHKRWSKSKGKYDNDYTPTQKAAEMFLFFVTENAIMQGGTLSFIKHTCYITGKGQVYFLNKFKELSKAA